MAGSIVVKGERIEWDTIGELLETRGRDDRDLHALEVCGRRLTYGEILDETNRVAANLHRLGVRKGDHVASMLPNHVMICSTEFGSIDAT